MRVSLPAHLTRYVVDKGSITVDGISLTVVKAGQDDFTVSLIPTTLELTTLGHKQPGAKVNLEVDVIAKYTERLLGINAGGTGRRGRRRGRERRGVNGLFDWANAVAFHAFGQTVKWSDLLGNILALATVGFALRRSIWTWPVQIAGCVLLFLARTWARTSAAAQRGRSRWPPPPSTAGSAGPSARKGEAGVDVRWASWTERGLVAVALAAGTAAFAELLTATHSSWAPWPDAYIFVGSLVATAAQARGLVEFWFVWVAVDVVGVPLAFNNGLAGRPAWSTGSSS